MSASSARAPCQGLVSSLSRLSISTCSPSPSCVPSLAARHPNPFTVTSVTSSSLLFARHASHKSQGAVNGPKDGAGRRLGAKKSGEQYVIPGNIIFRQRGTHWFPGENVGMGRDHTIFSRATGYVKFYKDPLRHPDRKYIGVVFQREDRLPYAPNSARRRRFGMVAVPRRDMEPEDGGVPPGLKDPTVPPATAGMPAEIIATPPSDPTVSSPSSTKKNKKAAEVPSPPPVIPLRPGYQYRLANWQIGRAAETAKLNLEITRFKPRDRFKAWRKTVARKARNAENQGLGRKKQGKKGN
ncbi:MAG: 54S ribosomal protein L2 mitochondrial [Caeruleum heppii]|nr:MAG: 54S ribosomal protein L2 mitochondrial [Caeruleum heppii]